MLEKLFGSKKKEAEREQREKTNAFLAKIKEAQWSVRLTPEGKTHLDAERDQMYGDLLRQGFVVVGESPRTPAIEKELATDGQVFIERERGYVAEKLIRRVIEQGDGTVAREDFRWATGAVYVDPRSLVERPYGPFIKSDLLTDREGVTILVKVKPKNK